MSYGYRKKAKITFVEVQESEDLKIYLNHKELAYYGQRCLFSEALKELTSLLKGVYHITIEGGGLSSQVELISKVLFQSIKEEELKNSFRLKYPKVNRTDERKSYPKLYGGKGSRSRSQKSYR